jgi:cytochrome c peroxidase
MQALKRVRRVGPKNFALKSLAAEQMQDRALATLRSRSFARPVRLSLLLAGLVAGLSCTQDGPLSDEEMTQLRTFMLPSGPPADTSNAYSDDPGAAKLGKKLYFDGRYAGKLLAPYNVAAKVNGALGDPGVAGLVSCRACHAPATGGADDRSQPNATSLGAGYTDRNATTVINSAYSPRWQFWDGRVDSLWSQALSPPEGLLESNSNRLRVVHFLSKYYAHDFELVFGKGALPPTIATLPSDGKPGDNGAFDQMAPTDQDSVNHAFANFGKAIAAYEKRLVSSAFEPSPFDAFMAGNKDAMSPAAIRGARLFIGHAGCAECHRGPTFTDFAFHNIGAPQTGEYTKRTDSGRYDGVGALTSASNMFNRGNELYSDDTTETGYLSELSGTTPDSLRGQFKTPTLRNVNKTAPYMHDGVYQTLWEVVNHYNFGGATGPYEGTRDPVVAPLMLTDAALGDLVEFLRALDDGPPLPTTDFSEGLVADPVLPPEPPEPPTN